MSSPILDYTEDTTPGATPVPGASSLFLLQSNNLSDLDSPSDARTNLGLGTLATQSGTLANYELLIGTPSFSGLTLTRSTGGAWDWVNKENAIALGLSTDYIRGDKTVAALNTDAVSGFSALGKTLAASADAATGRSTLGLGSLATQADTGTGTSVLRGNGSGGLTAATAGTHFLLPTGTLPLAGFSSITGTLPIANLPGGLGLTTGTLAQFAATTSAQLAGVITDKTGSNALVFANSPSLVTPSLGAATATSLTVSGAITTGGLAVATQQYVTDNAQGLVNKGASVAATTANITLSGAQTIDGVAVVAGNRVLVKNQTTAANNGLYIASAGAWTRDTEMNTWTEVPAAYTYITGGTTQTGTSWNVTSLAGGTLGTTAITWEQFSGGSTYSAGTGLTLAGSTFSLTTMAANTLKGSVAGGAPADLTATQGRTLLGLGSLALQDATAASITGGSVTGITDLLVADGGTGASTAAGARTNLGLGSIATQDASAVSITGGSVAGITDLALADGGTGASTAANARTNLGLGSIATQAASGVAITGGSIAGITDLALADGGTGASNASDARTNLGLGSMATQAADNVAITDGTVAVKHVTLSGAGGVAAYAIFAGGTEPFGSGVSTMIYADASERLTFAKSGTSAYAIKFSNASLTSNRIFTFPDAAGTLALTSTDLSSFPNSTNIGTSATNLTTGRIPLKARQVLETVYTDQANAFTGGFKNTFDGGVNIGGTTDPTGLLGAGRFAVTSTDASTFSTAQYNMNASIPNDARGAAIFLGKALGSSESAHLSFTPRATVADSSLNFGFHSFNDRLVLFRNGGLVLQNSTTAPSNPGAGNLSISGAYSGTSATMTGALTAASATVTGALTGASGSISGTLTTNQITATGVYDANIPEGNKQAFNVSQALSGATAPSNWAANDIQIATDISTWAGASTFASAFNVAHTFGQKAGAGTKPTGNRAALQVTLTQSGLTANTDPNVSYVAGMFQAVASSNDNGTNTIYSGVGSDSRGTYYGCNPTVRANSGATFLRHVSGAEIDVNLESGASCAWRNGITVNVGNTGGGRGGTYDNAIAITNGAGTANAGRWLNGIEFMLTPMATTGTLIKTTGAETVSAGLNFSSYTFSDAPIRLPATAGTPTNTATPSGWIKWGVGTTDVRYVPYYT